MTPAGWSVCVVTLLFPALLCAGEERPPLGLKGLAEWGQVSGSLRAGYWGSSRSLDDRQHLATSALWLKAEPRLWQNVSLTVEGWVRGEQLFREHESWGELREAYVAVRLSRLDLRLGKQIIVWGRADRLNPTDTLTPRNFTLLVPDDDDQRFGTPAIKATYYFGSLSFTGIWLAHFTPHIVPIQQPPPPVTLRQQIPGNTLGQGAIKLELTGKAVDWSLSFFDGFDLTPDIKFGQMSPSAVPLFLTYHRIRVIGADAATTVGRYGLRAEVAYTFTKDESGKNPLIKNPFFYLVMGSDRTFLEYLNVNVQYFLRVVKNFHNPVDIPDPFLRTVALRFAALTSQRNAFQQGVSLRVNYKWFNETLEGEIAGVLSFTRLDFVLRPKVVYAFTDRWKGTLGADIFRGSRNVFFGRLRQNSGAYVEMRYSF
jgi:hypothetical protein